MFRILSIALKYNLSAHASNLPNLMAAASAMFVNNVLFLLGIWGMLFAGKSQSDSMVLYYIALNVLVMTAWGGINFFFGGWIDLAELIVDGQFESKVSTPRHPLLLVAVHNTHPSAFGDLLMGVVGFLYLGFVAPFDFMLRLFFACGVTFISLFSLYVFSGSLAFFIPRGNTVATLIREMTISLSVYPVGKMFSTGMGRILLLLSPAGAVAVLPMSWIETSGLELFLKSLFAAIVFLALALIFFNFGKKRFQTVSVIGTQS